MRNPFFSLWHLVSVKKPPQPIKSPQYTVLPQEQLNLIERLVKDVEKLKKPEVRTHFAEDHETIEWHTNWINHAEDVVMEGIFNRLKDAENKIKDLDQKYLSFLTSRIVSASVQRRDKRGRFKAVRGKHVSA